jgi:hypothetical protein
MFPAEMLKRLLQHNPLESRPPICAFMSTRP